jgi:hypothetical protein
MKKFVFVYYNGGDPSQTSKEDMEQIMADWGKWFEEMGSSLVDGGNPFGPGMTVNAAGVSEVKDMPASGYTIINAENMEDAVEKAKNHPMHKHTNGAATIQVYETFPM